MTFRSRGAALQGGGIQVSGAWLSCGATGMPVGKVKYLQCLRDTDATPYETMPWVQLPHC